MFILRSVHSHTKQIDQMQLKMGRRWGVILGQNVTLIMEPTMANYDTLTIFIEA